MERLHSTRFHANRERKETACFINAYHLLRQQTVVAFGNCVITLL